MMIGISNVSYALKDIYLPVISNKLNTSSLFLSKLQLSTNDIWGKYIMYSKQCSDGSFIVFKSELSTLYASVSITDKMIKTCELNTGAFVDLLNDEMEKLVELTGSKLTKAICGKETLPTTKENKIVLNNLHSLFNNDMVYDVNLEKYNIKPKVETIDDISISEIQTVIDKNNKDINLLMCSPNVQRKILEFKEKHNQNIDRTLCGDNRYHLTLSESVVIDCCLDMPDDYILLINTNDFRLHQLCDWQWLNDENGNILKLDSNSPTYKATLVKYANIICHNPENQIKVIINDKK